MANDPRGDIPGDVAPAGTTGTVKNFARALGAHLPRRLAQLRELGRATRAVGKGKPPRR